MTRATRHPIERRWGAGGRPLPLRWASTAHRPERQGKPFNFSAEMRRLGADVIARCPVFAHIDPAAVLFTFTGSRARGRHGLLARVCPLRFRDGGLYRLHHGRVFQVQRYFVNGAEQMYVVTFCLPRFLDLPFDEKLVTVFHEFYHVGPRFDGDLRRHDGRCEYHTASQRKYDEHMARLVRDYLAHHPDPAVFAFLHRTFAQLWADYGGVYGLKIPRPKMVPVG